MKGNSIDALTKATQALIEARDELFEHNMQLEWELKITYVNTAYVKSLMVIPKDPPRRPECISQKGGSEK